MISSDRETDGYVRRDAVCAMLALGLASAVLLVGVDHHGFWDPEEVDRLARGARGAIAWLGAVGLTRRQAHAIAGCATVLLAARGASLLGGRSAALPAACVMLATPGLVLSGRLVILRPPLGALALVVGAIGAARSLRREARWIDLALMLGGAALLAVGPPERAAAPVASALALLLVRRPGAWRTALTALGALGIAGATAAAGARAAEDTAPGWASALEPAVYGALPWLGLAPWALLALAGRAPRHAGCAALITWAAVGPWIGDAASWWAPVSIACGVLLARGRAHRGRLLIGLAIAAVLALDVHRSAAGLAGVASEPEGLAPGWGWIGLAGPPLVALAALAARWPAARGLAAAASVATGLVLAHAWVPALSAELGHSELFAALPARGARLGVLGMRPESVAFWTEGTPRTLRSPREVSPFLGSSDQSYAVAPRDALCGLRQSARAAGRPLHVVGRDERLVLLANRRGPRDVDPLAGAIRAEPPARVGRRIDARLRHLDLLGMELPRAVRRGSTVEAALHFRVREPVPRDLRVFVHVDGPGPRIQGDHDPVGGDCPTSRWLAGDHVRDAFTFRAGSLAQAPGRYTVHVGLYHGAPGRWVNLPVLEGPRDRHDRVYVGELEIR